MRPAYLAAAYLGIVCLPVILAWFSGFPPRSFRNELASGLGLLAFAIILLEFLLSGRFRFISNGLGLDVTIRFHQLMGRIALIFMLIHPFAYQYLPGPERPWDTSRQLSITADFWSMFPGILAFLLLPTFVIASIYRDDLQYRYQYWRLLHGLGALLIAWLLYNHAVSAGRYSAQPTLVGMWQVMTGLAALSLLFVYVIKPLSQVRRPWRVSRVERLSPRQWDVRVQPGGHQGLTYKAGQFVWLNIGHWPFSVNENPFSISSAPSSGGEVQFVIKELGDFTGALDKIAIGTKAYLDGPHGTLTIAGRKEPGVVLIAGGVGVAPMLGILREMQRTDDPREAKLIYGNRSAAQVVFRDELEEMKKSDRIDVVQVLSEPEAGWSTEVGIVDKALLERIVTDQQIAKWLFVICGPPAMMTEVERSLMNRGVPAKRILSERFQYD